MDYRRTIVSKFNFNILSNNPNSEFTHRTTRGKSGMLWVMKSEITHTFQFMRARPVSKRHGKTKFVRHCESLPRFRGVDKRFFCWMPSDTALWLRELARKLPNHLNTDGITIVERYRINTGESNDSPEFLARLSENRLRQLFFGDMNFYKVRMEDIVFRRDGMTLTCHCKSEG